MTDERTPLVIERLEHIPRGISHPDAITAALNLHTDVLNAAFGVLEAFDRRLTFFEDVVTAMAETLAAVLDANGDGDVVDLPDLATYQPEEPTPT